MAFLSDTLRLEIKSIYDSNLVQFASHKKDANIHLVPEDSISHYSVITTSTHSNIDTHITLHSDDAEIEVATFTSNSINFGNDTLLRGNVIVFGSVFSLGYDVLTQENTFLLENFGSSAQKGVNSATQKNLAYLNNLSKITSNAIINYITADLSNMEQTLGISDLTTFNNNMFTINDFENLFAVKTLDDLNQGSSNHFITNNEYIPTSDNSNIIIKGTIISSNLHTNSITIDAIYAKQFFGDGTNVFNVNRYHFNTNELAETPVSSNLYFTNARAGSIAYASNIHASNYINNLCQSYNTLFATEDTNLSNFINTYRKHTNLVTYLPHQDIFDAHNDSLLSYFANSSDDLTNLNIVLSQSLSNYISDTCNILVEELNIAIQDTYNYTAILDNLNMSLEPQHIYIRQASNSSESILASSNAYVSNLILATHNKLLFCISQSNIHTIQSTNILLQGLRSPAFDASNYLKQSSNDIVNHVNNSFNILNTHRRQTSNNIIAALNYTTTNLSNYVHNVSKNLKNTIDTSYAFINKDVMLGVKEYSNLSLYSTSNTIYNVSNNILGHAYIPKQSYFNLSNLINTITTNNIPEVAGVAGSTNIYFTQQRFNNSLNSKTLDDLITAVATSNQVIRNNTYDGNLTIKGNVTAQNIIVYNSTVLQTDEYNTERLQIDNWSNATAILFYNTERTDNANIIQIKDSQDILTLKNDGKLGIKLGTQGPTKTLDVLGVIAANYFIGSGELLTQVKLTDKTTADLQEAPYSSNLYFRIPRLSEILIASNIPTSNFVNKLVDRIYASNLAMLTSNLFAVSILNDDISCSNYILNASNEALRYILQTPDNQWNYAIATSNMLYNYKADFDVLYDISRLEVTINRSSSITSNYVDLTSNILQTSNVPYTHIYNVSNILARKMKTIITDHSNLISGLSNLFETTYLTNRIAETANALSSQIKTFATYYSNLMEQSSNNLVSILKINITSISPYNAGDLYPYSHTYDPNILHLNFKDKKILNGVASDHFRLFSNSNFTNIYPVLDNFTILNKIPSYSSLNKYAFNANQQTYIYVNNQNEIKKLMNALHMEKPIGMHFVFHTLAQPTQPTVASILHLKSNDKTYLHIYVMDMQLRVNIGNDTIFAASSTPIVSNTWYIVDIIFDKTDNSITVDMYINLVQQQIYMKTVPYANNFAYVQGNSTTLYIGNTQALVKIQDTRIYSKSTCNDIIFDINNVLYYGLNNSEYTISSNVVIQAVRWLESSNYTSNYVSPFSRYITYTGNVGIGKRDVPEATLDIYTQDPSMYSIKTNNPIWIQSALLTSSDERIKTNIRGFGEQEALQKILAIQPKTYKYIYGSSDRPVYGFSAQQIRSVIPDAVSLHTNYIPNINSAGILYDNHFIRLLNDSRLHIPSISTVVIYYNGMIYYEEIEAIVNDRTFKIANKGAIPNAPIFVYGTVIEDFHTLDKNYIFTLNVCATQDLHRLQEDLSSNLNAFTPNMDYSNLEAIDALHSQVSILEAADISTANLKSTLEQIDYNLHSFSISQALNASNYVASIIQDLDATENNNKTVLEENVVIFENFNNKINDISIMQTDIENIKILLSNNNIK
jgi:hypothetical protein